jgi:hypothetical protein
VRGETGARKDDRCLGSPAGTAAVVRERKDQLEADGEGRVCAGEETKSRAASCEPTGGSGEGGREGGRPAGGRSGGRARPAPDAMLQWEIPPDLKTHEDSYIHGPSFYLFGSFSTKKIIDA